MTRRLEITVSEETWDQLNVARGHEPRASFVKRALESALAHTGSPGEDSRPAPSRASVPTPRERQAVTNIAEAVLPKTAAKAYSCPKPNCIYMSDSPGVCVHHRTERLK